MNGAVLPLTGASVSSSSASTLMNDGNVSMSDSLTPTSTCATTAPSSSSISTRAPGKRKRDATLDFFSSSFSPSHALASATLQPPIPIPNDQRMRWDKCEVMLRESEVWDDMMECIEKMKNGNTNNGAANNLRRAAPTASAAASLSAAPSATPSAPTPTLHAPPHSSLNHTHALNTHLYKQQHSAVNSAASSSSSAAATAFSPLSASSSLPSNPYPDLPPGLRASKMTPEQIQANREKAEAKSKANAELKAKQSHYLDRFTTSFPVPKPISTAIHRAKSVEGPMSLLRTFHTRKQRIYVVLRGSHGVRSILHGYLLAYDKHWNLILSDCEESYTEWESQRYGRETKKKLKELGRNWFIQKKWTKEVEVIDRGGETALPSSTAASVVPSSSSSVSSSPPLIRVEVPKKRHLPQIYVRGDSVISATQFQPTLFRPPLEGMEQDEKEKTEPASKLQDSSMS